MTEHNPPTTKPRYIQDDVKVVREYIAGLSVRGRPQAEESFQRIIEALEQWGGGKLDD